MQYYDGTKLLSMLDSNGNKPEIYMCTSNRSAGKTTYFNKLCVNKYLKSGEKFCLIYRYKYEMADVADKFFKDIQALFFPEYTMFAKSKSRGIYQELYLQPKGEEKLLSCGYAISLNAADQIKKYSHFFSDVKRMLFDEFQSETNNYCADEIQKLLSVHTSIARGNGQAVRYVPLYMVSNPVSIINPYYIEMGISNRLRDNTRFLKGDGFVLEQGFNAEVSTAQKESAFNRAFASNHYVSYAAENAYLNDNKAFIEKPEGDNTYMATVKCYGKYYGIREYPVEGIVYCSESYDPTFPLKIAVTVDDHNVNYVMLRKNDGIVSLMRWYFEHGCFRFKSLQAKEAILKLVSY